MRHTECVIARFYFLAVVVYHTMGQGGLIQLAATGIQDVYLTNIPQITFFKLVYRRYTPFAIESVEQSFNNSPGFGRKLNCLLVRAGDLAANMWLEITLTKSGPTFYPAEALLQEVYFTVGASTKHFPLWYRAYDEMYRSAEEKQAYRRCVDFAPEDPIGCRKKFYVPLLFTFNRFVGSALPIIGLEFHDLQMFVNMSSAPEGIDATQAPDVSLWIDYVFLDATERDKFAKNNHEYLIDQVQFTGPENATLSTSSTKSQQVRLNLNHPVKAPPVGAGRRGAREVDGGPRGDAQQLLRATDVQQADAERQQPVHRPRRQLLQPGAAVPDGGGLPGGRAVDVQLRAQALPVPAQRQLQLQPHRERHDAVHLEADLHRRHQRLRHQVHPVRPGGRRRARRPQRLRLGPQHPPCRCWYGRNCICQLSLMVR